MLKAHGLGEFCSTVRLTMNTFSLHTGWQTISIESSMMKLQRPLVNQHRAGKGKLCTTVVMKTLVIINKEQEPQARTHLLACFQHGVTPLHLQGRRTLLPHFWFFSAISPSPDRVGCIQNLFNHRTKQHTLALLLGWKHRSLCLCNSLGAARHRLPHAGKFLSFMDENSPP